jgi:hypothetical protein
VLYITECHGVSSAREHWAFLIASLLGNTQDRRRVPTKVPTVKIMTFFVQEDLVTCFAEIFIFLIFPSLYMTSGVPVFAASSRALRPARRSAASTPVSRPLLLVSFFCFTNVSSRLRRRYTFDSFVLFASSVVRIPEINILLQAKPHLRRRTKSAR